MAASIIDSLRREYQGKKVLIVGLGLQGGGVGVAKFFAELGSLVTVTDKKNDVQLASSIEALKPFPITYRLGEHRIDDFLGADVIFKGPGVPWISPEIDAASKKNIPIEMEMSFVATHFPGKMIGITGTRGKSTTTNLIFNILKDQGVPAHLGGGLPGISNIDYLKTLSPNDYLVAELSSWALSGFHKKRISPHIAVFTNIFPDHLNYYKDINEYLYDKKAIFLYQKKEDFLVANKSLLKECEGANSTATFFTAEDFPFNLKYLRGAHNLENAAAALKVSDVLGLNKEKAALSIENYGGLPFRQQVIGEKNQIAFVNDTTSTTPVATIKAISSFSDRPIYLILGGNTKNLPYEELLSSLGRVKKIILLKGSFTDEIFDKLEQTYPDKLSPSFDTLDGAISKAYSLALADKAPAYVLFSPGATSFAMFNNEFHRGREFNRQVAKILE